MDIETHVQDAIRELVCLEDTLVVGVSSGIDSTTLLHILQGFQPSLVVAHFNHKQRPESDLEAEFVANLVKGYDLPYFEGVWEGKSGASEEEMRDARYQFFRQVREKVGAKWIVTAHHLDDQAETILFNVLRGTGLRGLGGMKIAQNDLLRPLLGVQKSELESYAREKSLEHMEDSSNTDLKYTRNFIRQELVPKFKEKNPRWLINMEKLSKHCQEVSDFVEIEAENWLSDNFFGMVFSRDAFVQLPYFLQCRILQKIAQLAVIPSDTTMQECVRVIKEAQNKGKIDLRGTVFQVERNLIAVKPQKDRIDLHSA